jgi:hypothetical protein
VLRDGIDEVGGSIGNYLYSDVTAFESPCTSSSSAAATTINSAATINASEW